MRYIFVSNYSMLWFISRAALSSRPVVEVSFSHYPSPLCELLASTFSCVLLDGSFSLFGRYRRAPRLIRDYLAVNEARLFRPLDYATTRGEASTEGTEYELVTLLELARTVELVKEGRQRCR